LELVVWLVATESRRCENDAAPVVVERCCSNGLVSMEETSS
jgi:hypothetical protein